MLLPRKPGIGCQRVYSGRPMDVSAGNRSDSWRAITSLCGMFFPRIITIIFLLNNAFAARCRPADQDLSLSFTTVISHKEIWNMHFQDLLTFSVTKDTTLP